MIKSIKYLILISIIVSCDRNSNEPESLTSLLRPNFEFSQDLFDCNLNENISSLRLETFFSNFLTNTDFNSQSIDLKILFPINSDEINNFILMFSSDKKAVDVANFISSLQSSNFNNLAYCKYAINQNDGINAVSNLDFDDYDSLIVEILKCSYAEGYNFGSFKISLERFFSEIRNLKIKYSAQLVEDTFNKSNFIWINYFADENYKDNISQVWTESMLSLDIQKEFQANALCFESRSYKAFTLI